MTLVLDLPPALESSWPPRRHGFSFLWRNMRCAAGRNGRHGSPPTRALVAYWKKAGLVGALDIADAPGTCPCYENVQRKGIDNRGGAEIVDTDVLIDIQRGHPPALAWFAGLTDLPAVPNDQTKENTNLHELTRIFTNPGKAKAVRNSSPDSWNSCQCRLLPTLGFRHSDLGFDSDFGDSGFGFRRHRWTLIRDERSRRLQTLLPRSACTAHRRTSSSSPPGSNPSPRAMAAVEIKRANRSPAYRPSTSGGGASAWHTN